MENIKEEIKKWSVWFEITPKNSQPFVHYDTAIRLVREYAEHKCKEQRDKCVGVMPGGISYYHPTTANEIVDRVKNAPLPNFD